MFKDPANIPNFHILTSYLRHSTHNSTSVRFGLGTTFPPLDFHVSKWRPAHKSTSTRFGREALLESSIQPAGKSHKSRRSCQANIVCCVFYVEILGTPLGMNVTRILRKIFGNFR